MVNSHLLLSLPSLLLLSLSLLLLLSLSLLLLLPLLLLLLLKPLKSNVTCGFFFFVVLKQHIDISVSLLSFEREAVNLLMRKLPRLHRVVLYLSLSLSLSLIQLLSLSLIPPPLSLLPLPLSLLLNHLLIVMYHSIVYFLSLNTGFHPYYSMHRNGFLLVQRLAVSSILSCLYFV